jgi:hypothetical protein
MTIDHDILRAVLKNFPDMRSNGWESLLDLSRDYDTIRECHVFFQKLAGTDKELIEEVNTLMFTWRADMINQMQGMMLDRQQRQLREFGLDHGDILDALAEK